ncbi:PD-(D/E)XK nuclease-like domain-containing protein [Hymenobacter psychrophilus]|uniref:PD-(D/E)XK nuclease superfamily protein n=1 Tax=Hymenobacter psychrophilus TaxID=651662 RepID=A0A1H3ISN3_9BACT|nr:PD-(D/E)XK nuclease-like domain-containing protein [Hymenobacter psychrophilus]SDY30335.1 PD-(D/E)XK nuclease superfamily protein [Hymenobacter psychrophilus]
MIVHLPAGKLTTIHFRNSTTMFHRLTTHPGLTQQQHRDLPGLSNTDLSQLKAQVLGQLRNLNPAALAYGTAFHAATLEPATYQRTDERGIRWAELEQLARQVRRQRFCRDLLYRGTPELTHTALYLETGLLVKVRPDLLVRSPAGRRLTLLDFKTTSCRDQTQFLAAIEQYDYDRQAAFYLDVLQADRFLIVGVQKKAPHAIWVFELTTAPLLLEQGRKKYRRLLRAHAAQLPAHQPAALPLAA